MKSILMASLIIVGACSSSSTSSPGTCGAAPIGSQCKTSAGGCAPLQCIGSSWGCAAGQTEVGVVPGACSVADGGADGSTTDSGSVGACTAPIAAPTTLADGGAVTCYCEGPCGCFLDPDAGTRCPTGGSVDGTGGSDSGTTDSGGDSSGGTDSGNIGACTTPVATPTTLPDGGTVTCYCEGPCGCFLDPDAGTRCP